MASGGLATNPPRTRDPRGLTTNPRWLLKALERECGLTKNPHLGSRALSAVLDKAQGARTELLPDAGKKSKAEVLKEAGISTSAANRYEQFACLARRAPVFGMWRIRERFLRCGAPYVLAGERAAEAIASNPTRSDRAIAEEIGVNQSTVSRARKRTDAPASVATRTAATARSASSSLPTQKWPTTTACAFSPIASRQGRFSEWRYMRDAGEVVVEGAIQGALAGETAIRVLPRCPLLGAQRKLRFGASALQEDFVELASAVLHQCIRPLIGAPLCSGPSWISARVRSN